MKTSGRKVRKELMERKARDQRAAELIAANKELAFQNEEKEKRAAELIAANKELAFQNEEKEKRAAELIIANKELVFQNEEKEKRAAELIIANKELAFQNKEKKRRTIQTNKLKEKNIELETQKKILAEASQLKSSFLSNMSHELRTPLNAIIGFTELALKTDLDARQQNYLNKIKMSSYTLLGLISDILDLSKIETGKMELETLHFNLEEVLQNAISLVEGKSKEKGLKLAISIDGDVPVNLTGDSLRLGQIIINLLSNSIKFTDKGNIAIQVEMLENAGDTALIRFSVKDTGIGISGEELEKLFQPFTQADASTTRRYGGTGLGLAISKNLVSMMNGQIWAESKPGEGSTFFFTIRIRIDDKECFDDYRKSFIKSGMKALVVDDKEESREAIVKMLTDMSIEVTVCSSGEEAIAILKNKKNKNHYKLMIMNWKMAGMDGIETSIQIKKIFASDKAPAIILMTAYGGEGLQKKAEAIGLTEVVLYKPVTSSLLYNTILHACGKEGYEQIRKGSHRTDNSAYALSLYGIHALLVEDNEINREVAREILEQAGMLVTTANNGGEAVDQVRKNHYDIVLMDIQMPVMDGYDATREIRKDPDFADLPIVAMTANALPCDQERCLQAGMNDHISKPIDTIHLFQTIDHWVRKRQKALKKTTVNATAAIPLPAGEKPAGNRKNIPALSGVDVQTSLIRLGGNLNLFNRLLRLFYNNYKDSVKEVRNALGQGEQRTAEILVHNIKGASGNVGAQDVYKAASAVEICLHEDKKLDSKFYSLLEHLEQKLEQVFLSVSKYSESMEDMQSPAADGIDRSLLKPEFDILAKLLNDNDMDAVECAENICRQVKNTAYEKKLEEINDCVKQYDFENAYAILAKILNPVPEVSADEKS